MVDMFGAAPIDETSSVRYLILLSQNWPHRRRKGKTRCPGAASITAFHVERSWHPQSFAEPPNSRLQGHRLLASRIFECPGRPPAWIRL